jgi:hypothetical protein
MADELMEPGFQPDPIAALEARVQRRRERAESLDSTAAMMPEIYEAEEEVSNERRGHWVDINIGAARAIPGAVEETFELISALDEKMMATVTEWGLPDFRFGYDPRVEDDDTVGFFKLSPEESAQYPLQSMARTVEYGYAKILETMPETERASGAVVNGLAKFTLGFVTGKKALQGLKVAQGASRVARVTNAVLAGGAADAMVFDGHEGRLSDFLAAFDSPVLNNTVTQYLATDMDDTELEGRMKNIFEGAALGLMFDGFLVGIRGLRRWHTNNRIAKEEAKVVTEPQIGRVAETPEVTGKLEVDTEGQSTLIWERRAPRKGDEPGLGPDEAGKIEVMERGGETLQVINVHVERASQRLGKGKELYDAAAQQADERGLRLVSDTSVSDDAARQWERMARDGDDIIDQRVTNPDNVEKVKGQWQTRDNTPVFERAKKPAPEVAPKADDVAAPARDSAEMIDARRMQLADEIRGAVSLTREQAEEFIQAVRDGDDNVTERILADFNEKNIDWSKIESADDIKRVMLETEKVFAELTEFAKGGVQSNAQTKRIGEMLNATGTEVDKLFADVRGGGGIAARFYAAQRIMMSSAAEVIRTAKIAKEFPPDSQQAADALRALQMHAAIQAEVKGAQTEIARALQAMGMIKDAAADNFREFSELRSSFGRGGAGDKAWNNYMDDLLKSRSVNELNRTMELTKFQRMKNILIEYTVNAMLSSPKTHIINLTSNVLNTFIYSADRFLGGSYRYLAKGDKAALREARIDIVSKVTRLDEALKLAKQAWKDGMPVTDVRQRMEFGNRISIKMTGDSWIAKAVNTLGTVVRVPGRALIAGDEFFKAVTRNSEVSVLSFRQADEEALAKGLTYGDEAYEKFVQKRMAQLSDPDILHKDNQRIQMAARDKSRLTTFQESAITDVGAGAMHTLNSVPMVKLVIAPFFRTPMNIIRQSAFDRTPLGYLFKEHRRTLREGHPRDVAEQIARMTSGVAAMTFFYSITGVNDTDSGVQVVGKIPYDSSAKLSRVKDYSIRIGDTWYQFNRLEPMGMWMGAIADMKYAMEYADDEGSAFSYQQAAMGAFLNNVTNKTWAQSFTRILETFEGVATGRQPSVQRATAQLIAGEFGKLIPQFVKASARALEGDDQSFQSEAWDILDIMGERASLWGQQPPKHDLLGRPVPRDAGLSVVLNPFTHIKDSDDPVDKEFYRLGFVLPPMAKTLAGGSVDLTVEEYSKMTGLVADYGLHQVLTGLVEGESWETLTDPMKVALLKQQVNAARQFARQALLADAEVLRRVTQAKVDAAFLLVDEN